MVRKVTVAAFAGWIEDEANVEEVLRLVSEGKTLQKAAMAVKQPYMCLHPWFHETPERLARYEKARKAWADGQMDEALRIADSAPAERDAVAKARLQVDTRHNQAKAYHRERWGERLQVERAQEVPGDAGLLGFASELLKLVKAGGPQPRVVEPEQELLPAPKAED